MFEVHNVSKYFMVCIILYINIIHSKQLNRGYPIEIIEGTSRIFPMTLHVVGYSSPPPKPTKPIKKHNYGLDSLVWKLPVIHVEGHSKGSDRNIDDVRKVRGSVRMLQCGSVRWSLVGSLLKMTEGNHFIFKKVIVLSG